MAMENKLFQEALKRGSAHAWNEQWDKAAQQYRLAVQEFPEDTSARTYLAMALYKSGAYLESLTLYQSLWNAQPSNLTMLQRVAELQEAEGDREAAAMSYGRLADAHTRRRSPRDAFKAWQKVVELTPGNPLLWNSLVEMAVQAGTVKEVITGYLSLARDLALQSRFQEAVQIVEKAEKLDPGNPSAVSLLLGVRRAMQYWWRATSLNEKVYPEDLERLIPPIEVTEQTRHTEEPAAAPSPARAESEVGPRRPEADRPTITVYADSVTLSVNNSGLLSIQSKTAPGAQRGETAAEAKIQTMAGVAGRVTAELETQAQAANLEESQAESVIEPEPDIEPASAVEPEPVADFAPADLTWEEFEAMNSEPAAAEVEAPPEEEAPVAAEELEPVEAVSLEAPSNGEGVEIEVLETTEVPPALDATPVAAEVESQAPVAAEMERQAPAKPEDEQPGPAVVEVGEEPVATEEPEEDAEPRTVELEVLEDVAEEPAPEDSTARDWFELMREAEAARSSGNLREAIALYEESLATGAAVAQQFVGLGETHLQLGELDEAGRAFAQALELTPNKPEALAGLARIDLSNHKLDSAEQMGRRALESTGPDAPDIALLVVDLLLDILRERAAYGDLGGVTEGLVWLQSSAAVEGFSGARERIASTPRALLGLSVAEHLAEIAALPKQVRGEVTLALSKSEQQIEAGRLRSGADEMYRILASYPDFLPAQSVLGRILVAQGRLDEAAARAQRLIVLYRLRGRQEQSLEVLLWMVRAGMGSTEEIDRLVGLLRGQGRDEEAETIETGVSLRSNGAAAALDVASALPEVAYPVIDAEAVEDTSPAEAEIPSSDVVTGDGMLRLAESRFAFGDAEGAAGLIQAALQDERIPDVATRAALLRVLQLTTSAGGHRDALIDTLRELRLPEDLAD